MRTYYVSVGKTSDFSPWSISLEAVLNVFGVPMALSLFQFKQRLRHQTGLQKGLSVAHCQSPPVIHRDIKPQNILVGFEADGLRARLSDFGLAKQVNPLTLMASARGTRCFKSPEAFDDFNSDSCAGDIWAIGTTLYLLLTDKLPFNIPQESTTISRKNFAQEPVVPVELT